MSDIPEAFMKAAASVVTAGCGCQASDIDQCSYHRDGSCRWQRDAIARALMAADEAATKRERERCAGIVLDRMPATQDMNPVTDALEDVYAILKGEA